ncbi:MAG: efflux transporter outer membrane subunit [Verrucomicrobiales bacterium]|nr:efflux transporter outer membrane subunit [Verrucomicrobiales bacterium]MCP5528278.1 efflux transporter outer membrane subunit [Verrucomicrobiales bacterium]
MRKGNPRSGTGDGQPAGGVSRAGFQWRTVGWLAGLLVAIGAGCKTGPDYERPEVETPDAWRWKAAEPRDHVPRGEWWRVYGDPRLDDLEWAAMESNLDLQAALARVDQARAVARISRSDFFPTVNGAASFTRYRSSGNAPTPLGFTIPSFHVSQWSVPFDLSYEFDVWGKVRRGFEAARNRAVAAEAARQSLMLTLQADVAANYFSLVGVAEQIRTLEETIALRREALKIFEQRLAAGVGTEFEVERTKVEIATADADLGQVRQREAELGNALAILCGRPPSDFVVEVADRLPVPPEIAPDIPASMLERRPDVAEAERQLVARNAEIGVAKAALFPSIRLTAQGGFQSGDLEDLFLWESRTWGISPQVTVPIFEGGRLRADLERSRAAYDEAVATYRQKVLVAFREVDDSLAAIRFLQDRYTARAAAVEAAGNSAEIALKRFSAGTVSFLEVVDAASLKLNNDLARIAVATEQLNATVRLIKALGGGWEEPQLSQR